MTKKEFNQFKKELSQLLIKYNASLSMNVEGDTHGIYNDYLILTTKDKNNKRQVYQLSETWTFEG